MKNISHPVAPLATPVDGGLRPPSPASLHELEECSSCREMFFIRQVMLDEDGKILCAACSESKLKL
jgi:formylmethanofuran dehydrogenase subunit E